MPLQKIQGENEMTAYRKGKEYEQMKNKCPYCSGLKWISSKKCIKCKIKNKYKGLSGLRKK